tara:strand:+ start:1238 stop:1447 length:210 start_codon:yes stop_codon:yes gene_type:complete
MPLPILAIAKVAKAAKASAAAIKAAKAAKALARAKKLASTFGNKSGQPTALVPQSTVNYNAMGDALKNA